MDSTTPPIPAPRIRPFVTPAEAAEILNITRGTVYRAMRAGILPHSRVRA